MPVPIAGSATGQVTVAATPTVDATRGLEPDAKRQAGSACDPPVAADGGCAPARDASTGSSR